MFRVHFFLYKMSDELKVEKSELLHLEIIFKYMFLFWVNLWNLMHEIMKI